MMKGPLNAKALLVGVAGYRNVTPLPQAVHHDVDDIAAVLRDPGVGAYASDAVQVLKDGEATNAGLRQAFAHLAAALAPQDSFLLYFSGHGYRDTSQTEQPSYLIAEDSRLDALDSTAIRDDELLGLLRALPSQRQVVILDSCHAGGIGTLKSAGHELLNGVSEKSVARLAEGRGRVVLGSSREDEVSLILKGERNSLFTGSLLRALCGGANDRGDGAIGVFDLFSFVAADVPKHGDQHPVFKADNLEENFAVALKPASSKTVARPTTAAGWSGAAEILAKLYPLGPTQSEIWLRAGGDLSRLSLNGHGVAQWHAALMTVERGGGGVSLPVLLDAALDDFPGNRELRDLRDSL